MNPLRVFLCVCVAACGPDFLHAENPPPSGEVRLEFVNYEIFLAQEFKKAAESGLGVILIGEKSLLESQKRCDALVAAAKERADISKAARQVQAAYRYAAAGIPTKDPQPPEDKELAALVKNSDGRITEGRMLKACVVMRLRLAKFFGEPSLIEEKVMAAPDSDPWSFKIEGADPVPQPMDQTDEARLAFAADSTLEMEGRKITEADLLTELGKREKKARDNGRKFLLTISADENAKYENLEKLLESFRRAGITDIIFQAQGSE